MIKPITKFIQLIEAVEDGKTSEVKGREINGVFVPAEIEDWIDNVLVWPLRVRDSNNKIIRNKISEDFIAEELKTIIKNIYPKFKNYSIEQLSDQKKGNNTYIFKTLAEARSRGRIRTNAVTEAKNGNWYPWMSVYVDRKKSSVIKQGIPFKLVEETSDKENTNHREVEYIMKYLFPKDGKCPVAQKSFIPSDPNTVAVKGPHPLSPTLDQFIAYDNGGPGYVAGNVAVISQKINSAKRNGTVKEFQALLNWLQQAKSLTEAYDRSKFKLVLADPKTVKLVSPAEIVNGVSLPVGFRNWLEDIISFRKSAVGPNKKVEDYTPDQLLYLRDFLYLNPEAALYYSNVANLTVDQLYEIRNRIKTSMGMYIKKKNDPEYRKITNAKITAIHKARSLKDAEIANIQGFFSKNYINKMIRSLTTRSKLKAYKAGLPVPVIDLDVNYIRSIWPSDNRCPVFGTVFKIGGLMSKNVSTGVMATLSKFNPESIDSPSIDRIDPSKGYIKGNVAIISFRANELKSDLSVGELSRLINYMSR